MDALKRTLGCALVVLGTAVGATGASAAPALWKVSDDDSSIWLFGSVHMLDPTVTWRTPTFDGALDDADEVYFELVLDGEGMADLIGVAAARGYLPPGETLTGLLSKDQNKQLDVALDKLGLDRSMVDPMQPWMAGLMMSTVAMQQNGGASAATFESGVESQLQAEVADDRERGLETAAEQLGLLAMGTPEEQAAALMATLDQLDEATDAFGGVVDAWLACDVDAVHAEIEASVGGVDSEQYKLLITDRNKRWTVRAGELLATNVDALIVVGAAHLVGPVGLPALLSEDGYAVERIE